jgi:hypothetical protein
VSSTPLWPVWREGLPAEGWPRPGVVVGWAAAAAPLAAACWPARPSCKLYLRCAARADRDLERTTVARRDDDDSRCSAAD